MAVDVGKGQVNRGNQNLEVNPWKGGGQTLYTPKGANKWLENQTSLLYKWWRRRLKKAVLTATLLSELVGM